MNYATTFKGRIFEEIAEVSGVKISAIEDDTRLSAELAYDELDRFQLMMELEKVFDIDVPDSKAENWETAKDVFDFVEGELNKQQVKRGNR